MLIIEDEEYLRYLYKELFISTGEFGVDAYGTGKEGLSALEKTIYDVVLLDIILPDIHGLDILARVKQDQKMSDIPIILLTNLDQDIILRKGFMLGAAGYLVKVSYTPEQIVAKVKNILKEHKEEKNKKKLS